jgi:hypothetical protein
MLTVSTTSPSREQREPVLLEDVFKERLPAVHVRLPDHTDPAEGARNDLTMRERASDLSSDGVRRGIPECERDPGACSV